MQNRNNDNQQLLRKSDSDTDSDSQTSHSQIQTTKRDHNRINESLKDSLARPCICYLLFIACVFGHSETLPVLFAI